jgi:hypothetical protein
MVSRSKGRFGELVSAFERVLRRCPKAARETAKKCGFAGDLDRRRGAGNQVQHGAVYFGRRKNAPRGTMPATETSA